MLPSLSTVTSQSLSWYSPLVVQWPPGWSSSGCLQSWASQPATSKARLPIRSQSYDHSVSRVTTTRSEATEADGCSALSDRCKASRPNSRQSTASQPSLPDKASQPNTASMTTRSPLCQKLNGFSALSTQLQRPSAGCLGFTVSTQQHGRHTLTQSYR